MAKNSTPLRDADESDPKSDPLEDAIETERMRLGRAQSVLGCLRVALTYDEEDRSLDFADVVEVARTLIREAIDGLDSVTLRPLTKPAPKRRRRVKDLRVLYLPRPLSEIALATGTVSAP